MVQENDNTIVAQNLVWKCCNLISTEPNKKRQSVTELFFKGLLIGRVTMLQEIAENCSIKFSAITFFPVTGIETENNNSTGKLNLETFKAAKEFIEWQWSKFHKLCS